MTREQSAALAIRDVLMAGGSLESISNELGRLAMLSPTPCLPVYAPIFNAQMGMVMEKAYRDGITHIQRFTFSTT